MKKVAAYITGMVLDIMLFTMILVFVDKFEFKIGGSIVLVVAMCALTYGMLSKVFILIGEKQKDINTVLEEVINDRFNAIDTNFKNLNENLNEKLDCLKENNMSLEAKITNNFENVSKILVKLATNTSNLKLELEQHNVELDKIIENKFTNLVETSKKLNNKFIEEFNKEAEMLVGKTNDVLRESIEALYKENSAFSEKFIKELKAEIVEVIEIDKETADKIDKLSVVIEEKLNKNIASFIDKQSDLIKIVEDAQVKNAKVIEEMKVNIITGNENNVELATNNNKMVQDTLGALAELMSRDITKMTEELNKLQAENYDRLVNSNKLNSNKMKDRIVEMKDEVAESINKLTGENTTTIKALQEELFKVSKIQKDFANEIKENQKVMLKLNEADIALMKDILG